jgi:hypothetical protein
MGVTLNELTRSSVGSWDKGKSLTVKLSSGSLNSVSDAAVLNGANLCAIGDGSTGNWELFQFARAELVAPSVYDLSKRLRGQVGTDGIMPDVWPVGSRIVILNSAVRQIDFDSSLRGLARHYRIGPAGKSYVEPVYRHYVRQSEGIGLRPYAPCHVSIRPRGPDLEISWVRRTRIEGDSWHGQEVPLSEAEEAYLVRVIGDAGLAREITVSAPVWTYSAEDRIQDGPVTAIEVAQISQSFGPGLFKRKEFNV